MYESAESLKSGRGTGAFTGEEDFVFVGDGTRSSGGIGDKAPFKVPGEVSLSWA